MWFDLGILSGLALTGLLLAPAIPMLADNSAPVPSVVIDNLEKCVRETLNHDYHSCQIRSSAI
jgi:hypothetical protein